MARWDRHAIKAAVHRAGYTLERLALEADLTSSACRVALHAPQLGGEIAIATFLGVDPAELWPDRYRAPMSDGRSSALDEFRTSHADGSSPANREVA